MGNKPEKFKSLSEVLNKPKFQKSHDKYLKATKAGDIKAWAELGYDYLYGIGTERDAEKALECFRKGAEAGDMYACFAIYDDMYGSGVSLVTTEEAMDMCIRAALLGYGKAAMWLTTDMFDPDKTRYALAYCHEKGILPEVNMQEAVRLYEEDAEKGGYHSMMRLYDIYENGIGGVPVDEEKAARYLFMSGYGKP